MYMCIYYKRELTGLAYTIEAKWPNNGCLHAEEAENAVAEQPTKPEALGIPIQHGRPGSSLQSGYH